jgi:hypothetical protein
MNEQTIIIEVTESGLYALLMIFAIFFCLMVAAPYIKDFLLDFIKEMRLLNKDENETNLKSEAQFYEFEKKMSEVWEGRSGSGSDQREGQTGQTS